MFGIDDPVVLAAAIAAVTSLSVTLVSLIGSGIGFLLTYLASNKRLAEELKLEHSAEKAVQLLLSRGWQLRSFDTMKSHLPGLGDKELKQLLIRSGAIAFKVEESDKDEYWGLVERCTDLLSSNTNEVRFKMAGDPPKLTKISNKGSSNDVHDQ